MVYALLTEHLDLARLDEFDEMLEASADPWGEGAEAEAGQLAALRLAGIDPDALP